MWLTTAERFRAKYVIDPSGCWSWTGAKDSDGYAMFRVGKSLRASRYIYEVVVGPIPAGLVIDHVCCNRSCVNPAHMEPVTRKENSQRGSAVQGRRRTTCRHGHPIDGFHGGRRRCKTCAAEYSRRYRARIG